jgi:hypothetical protein
MITLTLYIYFFLTGEVEWNQNLALGLAAFDLLMASKLTDVTLVEMSNK